MTLCDKQHDEVCYEGRSCPACAVRDELEGQIADLKLELKGVEEERDHLLG